MNYPKYLYNTIFLYLLMFKNKKANFMTIKAIIILLISTAILGSLAYNLPKLTNIEIQDKRLQTQVIQTKIFNSNCFSTEYGIIEEEMFTKENLEKCFNNAPANLAFFIEINKKSSLYIHEKSYQSKANFCGLNEEDTNILCSNMKYPITFRTKNKDLELRFLRIQTIIG